MISNMNSMTLTRNAYRWRNVPPHPDEIPLCSRRLCLKTSIIPQERNAPHEMAISKNQTSRGEDKWSTNRPKNQRTPSLLISERTLDPEESELMIHDTSTRTIWAMANDNAVTPMKCSYLLLLSILFVEAASPVCGSFN